MKICHVCNVLKSIEDFSFDKKSKDGRKYQCKKCHNDLNKKYRQKNLLKFRQQRRERYKNKREIINNQNKESYYRNIEKRKETNKKYYEKYKKSIYQKFKMRLSNPDVWEKRKIYQRKWQEYRRKSDTNFRIKKTIQCRMWSALKGLYKSKRTEELLGCSILEFRNYLQLKFSNNMNWENYGKWHIDHILPCDSFDLSQVEEQKKCFHYTNLQPMWAIDNILKSNKIL